MRDLGHYPNNSIASLCVYKLKGHTVLRQLHCHVLYLYIFENSGVRPLVLSPAQGF